MKKRMRIIIENVVEAAILFRFCEKTVRNFVSCHWQNITMPPCKVCPQCKAILAESLNLANMSFQPKEEQSMNCGTKRGTNV